MFYNALTRKGKGEGVKEHDMSGVVAIHNNMNERAWAKIAAWEKLHCEYVIWTAVAPQPVAETTQHHLLAFVLLSPLLPPAAPLVNALILACYASVAAPLS